MPFPMPTNQMTNQAPALGVDSKLAPADFPTPPTPVAEPPGRDYSVIRIQPIQGWVSLHLRELWAYRELLVFMVWRDISVRYKQTALGVSWAVIQPVFTMAIFSLLFGKLAKLDSDSLPYPVWCFAALVPWTFFANGLSSSANSLVLHQNLIKKVYFPRLTIPISAVLTGVVDFAIAFGILIVLMLWYGITPTANIVFIPFFLLLTLVTSLGVGLWLCTLNVQFRDVRHAMPFLTQLWFYGTPIAYSSTLVSQKYGAFWQAVYGLNPMAGVAEGFRWALLGAPTAPGPIFIASSVTSVLLLVSGAFYFRRMEKTFSDLV